MSLPQPAEFAGVEHVRVKRGSKSLVRYPKKSDDSLEKNKGRAIGIARPRILKNVNQTARRRLFFPKAR